MNPLLPITFLALLPTCALQAAQTGTAETMPYRVDSNGDKRIDTRDRIVYTGDNAWFVGFAPYRNPQVAVAVLVEYGGGGGKHAGPIARETLRACKQFGYIK